MLDAISVEHHGVDTVRATFRVLDAIPARDSGFQTEMMGAGFRHEVRSWIEDGQRVESDTFAFQDEGNSTLRYWLRGGEYLQAEFSAPRLLDDSPVNLRLAQPAEVMELLEFAGSYGRELIPGAPSVQFYKLNRLDYACDLAAGSALPGVISAGAQFRFPGTRKASAHTYPGESSTIRSSQRTFRAYGKGMELEAKLSPAERKQYANVIQLAREKGLTRMEMSNRTKGGLSVAMLTRGARDFSERLEAGFPGGVVSIGGLARLEAQISSLGLSSQRESTLIKFATRYATLGEDGMKARYSKGTFHRHKRMFLDYGLRLDDVCEFSGEIDFRPVIETLRAA